jgi:hypothetical protein
MGAKCYQFATKFLPSGLGLTCGGSARFSCFPSLVPGSSQLTGISSKAASCHGLDLLGVGHVGTFVKAALQIPESNCQWENHVIG